MDLAGVPGTGSEPREPTHDEVAAWARRMAPPDNELGWPVPIAFVLARTSEVAVMVGGITAYTAGVSFTVAVRARTRPEGLWHRGLMALVGGRPTGELDPAQQLLLGVEYPDGRTAMNLDRPGWPPEEASADEPRLVPRGGHGSDVAVDQAYWLSPVPPDGALTFVCSWQAFGIPETEHVVDDANLATASSRAQVLWPWQPPNERAEPSPEPRWPGSGWFGNAARRRRATHRP